MGCRMIPVELDALESLNDREREAIANRIELEFMVPSHDYSAMTPAEISAEMVLRNRKILDLIEADRADAHLRLVS